MRVADCRRPPAIRSAAQSGASPTLAVPAFVGIANYAITRREAFGVLDLWVAVATDRWTLAVFANNALDRKYLNEVFPAIEFGGSFAKF